MLLLSVSEEVVNIRYYLLSAHSKYFLRNHSGKIRLPRRAHSFARQFAFARKVSDFS